jgi:methylmalonyl-CoA mutase N-terminal domain/subunit
MMETEETRREFTTWSGIPIKELYAPKDVEGLDYERDLGFPGEPPFTRGVYRTMYRGRQFTIRRFTGVESPEDTNKLYRRELELGQTGLAIAPDVPTSTGLDSDNPRCKGDVGFCGVPIDSIQDMEVVFDGIPLDKVTTWTYSVPLTAMYFVNAENRGYDLKVIGGTTPTVSWPTPSPLDLPWEVAIEGRKREAMDFAEWTAENVPKWHSTGISVYAPKDNGLNCIQEMGILLGTAITAADAWKERGKVALEVFFRRISFEMATANDFFEEICKLRAIRRMWTKICRERYGITDPRLMQFRVRCQTQGSTNVVEEPLNNIIRIAFGMLASTLGGAQSLHANGYDEALCIPTDQSMLLSVRTLQIIQEETNVTSTVDPLAGSYYVEWLTNELEKRTWDYLKKIEDMGGMIAAIKSGFFVNEYKKANYDWIRKIETGERVVVGVNKYRLKPEEVPYKVPVYKFEPTCRDRQIERVKKLRKERDSARVARALKELEKACRGDENTFPFVMEAFRAYATLQEVCDVWREVYGLDHHSRIQI